ncbi:hypothetical protein J6590_010417 [Homalodisca vitripennis]|nr:hypothetical protein J6590_010417 [Homalodisca vitripennis]
MFLLTESSRIVKPDVFVPLCRMLGDLMIAPSLITEDMNGIRLSFVIKLLINGCVLFQALKQLGGLDTASPHSTTSLLGTSFKT